eukprot:c18857_g1_i1 orf=129-1361(+)
MAADKNGLAKPSALALLPKLLPQDTLQQWINMDPPPQQLAEDEALREEAKHWLAFSTSFEEGTDWKGKIQSLDTHLLKRSVLCGLGISILPVDIAAFLAIRDTVVNKVLPSGQDEYPNVVRWFDYIQGEDKVASFFETVPIRKSSFEPQDYSDAPAKRPGRTDQKVSTTESKPNSNFVSVTKEETKQQQQTSKTLKVEEEKSSSSSKKEIDSKEKELDTGATKKEDKKGKDDKAAVPKKEEKKGDGETNVSVLDIRVGLIVKVWKHPSADALLVEEIDLGESGIRQVVSGLARYLKEEELLNRKVALIANVKPGKLRDVVSAGLVLCASTSDHSSVEPLMVPDGAAVGEKIIFAGYDGKPEEVLNPKKKQLEKIFPDLCTDDNGVATYRGIPFMTSAGPCKSSLVKAAVK